MRHWPLAYGFLILLFGTIAVPLLAQQVGLSNQRQLRRLVADTIPLPAGDLPATGSLILLLAPGDTLPAHRFKYQSGYVYLQKPLPRTDSLWLSYRRLAIARTPLPQTKHSARQVLPDSVVLLRPATPATGGSVFDLGGLDYQGSFSRGLSFGNRQDLVLNSNFNLQMNGDLGDGIRIRAAISDENIPLQPEGNTQQLQDFDRVFVEIQKDEHRLQAGDYELTNPTSYFSRFLKKLQGLTFENSLELGDARLRNRASFALARGTFSRINLDVQEGNQGPYQLRGADGQRFVVILSGTEQVWLDGQLLERGIDRDYVIDYNLGEIRFTNRQLIRRESRVIVEYEYSNQSFARSLVTAGSAYEREKSTLSINLFSQQDARTSTGLFPLTNEDRQILSAAGDDPARARSSSARLLEEYSPARVAYIRRDSLTPCGPEQILIPSADTQAELYTASFSFLGAGRGRYRLADSQTANEPVYEYVGRDPATCELLGDYEPIVQLPRPQAQRLLTARHHWQPDDLTSWTTELAWSSLDQNRFSGLDQDDNLGLALYSRFQKDIPLSQNPDNDWQVHSEAYAELKSTNFQALNPYRPQEFLRDWTLADFSGRGSVVSRAEQLFGAQLGLQHPERGYLQYQLDGFNRAEGDFFGVRHSLNADYRQKGWSLRSNSSFLQATTATEDRLFLRPRLEIEKAGANGTGWRWSARFEAEQNERSAIGRDSLSGDSFAFFSYRLGLNSPEEAKLPFEFFYKDRTDYQPKGSVLAPLLRARELAVESAWEAGRGLRLQGNLIYRNLRADSPGDYQGQTGSNFLGRVTTNLNLGKGLLRSSLNYEIGGGQEPRRNFTFVRVRQGEGNYIWLDSLYNNDRVVQPNEMEIAPFADQADFVRVSTFSNEFLQTSDVDLNWSLQLTPRALWFNSRQKLKLFLNRFSNQTSLRIERRGEASESGLRWNPFDLEVADTNLIAANVGLRNILFFNRGHRVYEIQLGWTDNRRKNLLNNGFESRTNAASFLKLRLKWQNNWLGNLTLSRGYDTYDSELFDNKDYELRSWSIEPGLTWSGSADFQWEVNYKLEIKDNRLENGADGLEAHEFGTTLRWNPGPRTSLEGRASLVQIDFAGQPLSPVGFAMLNGLQAGSNLLWNLSLDRQLGKNLSLQLRYEGRKTGTARIVHVGRAQVAALF